MIRFSKEYSKLKEKEFTTIRRNTKYYKEDTIYTIRTPKNSFQAKTSTVVKIKKADITNELSLSDADCSKEALIQMLERWYGLKFDDFVLITMRRL